MSRKHLINGELKTCVAQSPDRCHYKDSLHFTKEEEYEDYVAKEMSSSFSKPGRSREEILDILRKKGLTQGNFFNGEERDGNRFLGVNYYSDLNLDSFKEKSDRLLKELQAEGVIKHSIFLERDGSNFYLTVDGIKDRPERFFEAVENKGESGLSVKSAKTGEVLHLRLKEDYLNEVILARRAVTSFLSSSLPHGAYCDLEYKLMSGENLTLFSPDSRNEESWDFDFKTPKEAMRFITKKLSKGTLGY